MSCNSGSQDCNFHCPEGGTWFVCEKPPYFVGCCATDPCSNTDENSSGCKHLYPASFDADVYESLQPNTCIGAGSENWYTCNFTKPKFLGCCKSNPCREGSCPDDELIPAAVGSNRDSQLPLFLDGRTPSEDDTEDDGGGGLSNGAIAGIAVGAAVAAIIIAVMAFFLVRSQRRKRAQQSAVNNTGLQRPHMDESGNFYHAVSQNGDPRFSGTPISPTSKHRASSSIGTSYGSPTLTADSRPMSEVYAPSRADEYRLSHGLQVDGTPMSPGHIKVIPELDSTPNEVHELEGK